MRNVSRSALEVGGDGIDIGGVALEEEDCGTGHGRSLCIDQTAGYGIGLSGFGLRRASVPQ